MDLEFTNKFTMEGMQERLLKLFERGGNWERELDKMAPDSELKRNLLSAAGEIVKKSGHLPEAMRIAKHYALDPDPTPHDKFHEVILKGDEDVRYIVTVRGMLCWLLLDIASKLESSYYTDILDMLEGRETDTEKEKQLRLATGENLYIRQQATNLLEFFAANIYAQKYPNGDDFIFDRERVGRIAFRMLEESKDVPRMLEALAKVFNRLRRLNGAVAYRTLQTFLYKEGSNHKILNPDYVLHEIIPLALFYAAFKKEHDPNFNEAPFVELFEDLIRKASPAIKGTITWYLWRAVDEKEAYYDNVKQFIPILLEPPFCGPVVNQFDFLIEKIIPSRPEEVVRLFDLLLNYIKLAKTEEVHKDGWGVFLAYFENILAFSLQVAPRKFNGYLLEIFNLWQRGIYVGHLPNLLNLYKQAPAEYQEQLARTVEQIKANIRRVNPNIPLE